MVTVYVASAMATDYPYKLQKPSTIRQEIRDTADSYILDSGIGDEVSNNEVLDLADEYNPEYVVGKDYLHDQAKTTESVREFMESFQDRELGATPLIPLQPPFDEHYKQLSGYEHYVLGGMAVDSVPIAKQLKWIRDFRKAAPDVYAHALGVGGGIEFVRKVAGTGLLDSVDCATPEMAAQYGAVLDKRLRQTEVREYNGEGASKRNIPLAEFNSWQIQDVWEREANKQGLEQWGVTSGKSSMGVD